MTTIAYDTLSLAADRQLNSGSARDIQHVPKLFLIAEHDCVLGAAGNYTAILAMRDDYAAHGKLTRRHPKVNAALVMHLDDGRCCYYEQGSFVYETTEPIAVGSGEQFALGALMAGATADDAVRIASRLDTATGGGVDVVHKRSHPAKLAKRAKPRGRSSERSR